MNGTKLDVCLNLGYFRMQQQVFTCQYVVFDNTYYPAYWLRINLSAVVLGPKQSRLMRVNSKFSVAVKAFVLSNEIESLYSLYRGKVDFDAPESVEACLLGGARKTVFDTYVVEVRDEGKLIAAGIFDNGQQSIAGIMNFYDPDYRKYSLGKYLMLLKMKHAQAYRKTYYYPGYIIVGYPKFDYKLFACEAATEVLDDTTGRWFPFSWETVTSLVLDKFDRN